MEAQIYNYKRWIGETNPERLKNTMNRFLQISGYTILNFVEHHFSPQGYTSIWLLAESHLAIHTFPEKNTTYIELSGCNKFMNQRFEKLFENWQLQLNPKELAYQT